MLGESIFIKATFLTKWDKSLEAINIERFYFWSANNYWIPLSSFHALYTVIDGAIILLDIWSEALHVGFLSSITGVLKVEWHIHSLRETKWILWAYH